MSEDVKDKTCGCGCEHEECACGGHEEQHECNCKESKKDKKKKDKKEIEALTEWTEEKLHEVTVKIATKLETKAGQVYTVHRIALSGVSVTPGGSVELADILGKEESLNRIKKCIGWL